MVGVVVAMVGLVPAVASPAHAVPDRIAFVSDRDGTPRDGRYEVYEMDADGSAQTPLTGNAASDGSHNAPAWSPDGTRIAFTSGRNDLGWPEVYVMNGNGTAQTRLSNDPSWDGSAAWRPTCLGYPFSDVPPWVADAAVWAYCEGFASGYPDNTFRPNWNITRAQVTNMLHGIHA